MKNNSIVNLKAEIEKIRQRNEKVEADKAWEISLTRRILITVLTYIGIVILFFVAGLPRPFINSIVPAIAFLLSTLTLTFFKKIWLENRK